MNAKHWRHSSVATMTALALTGALLTTSSSTVIAQSNESASGSGLVGTWIVEVTLRDCLTAAPLGPAFRSLVTFHRGGTLSESPGTLAFAIGQRSSGQGVWTQQGGRTYLQQMIALILFDTPPNVPGLPGFDPSRPVSPGFSAGWQTVTHSIELLDASHFTSSGANAFYKSDGTVYRSGCSTSVAQRFE